VAGIRKLAKPDVCYGFAVDPRNGATIPANSAAIELWDMGLNNNKKFFENKKTELQLVAEALELPYRRDEYVIRLDESERTLSEERFKTWSRSGETTLIGLNTGTSGVVPNKTISIEFWRTLIKQFSDRPEVQMVLLGGSSDEERNRKISNGLSVILSPTQLGLRDGLASVNAMDVVVTGDSLGMHMAIALRKPTVAWFGPTCSHEIDLYDRGIKLATHYRCSPCWKRTCLERVPCNQAIELAQMKTAILNLVAVPKSSRESLSSL
jgi:heptosyltransferase-2